VPPSPIEGDLYDLSRKLVKDLKLSILFLSHIMYHDDNKLTKAEKNTIKTLLEEKKYYLEESDKIELDSFINNKPSLGFVVDYVKENDYDFKEVERLILLTIIITERDPKYERVIDNLEKKLIIEMDY